MSEAYAQPSTATFSHAKIKAVLSYESKTQIRRDLLKVQPNRSSAHSTGSALNATKAQFSTKKTKSNKKATSAHTFNHNAPTYIASTQTNSLRKAQHTIAFAQKTAWTNFAKNRNKTSKQACTTENAEKFHWKKLASALPQAKAT